MSYKVAPEESEMGSWGGARSYPSSAREIIEWTAENLMALKNLMTAMPCTSGQEYYLLAQMAEAGLLKAAAEMRRAIEAFEIKHNINQPPAQTLE